MVQVDKRDAAQRPLHSDSQSGVSQSGASDRRASEILSPRPSSPGAPAPAWWSLVVSALMLLLGSLSAASVWAEEKEDDAEDGQQVDHLGLAARMLHDGHPGRALSVLAEMDTKTPGLDLARFHLLRGFAHAEQERFAEARKDFEAALAKGQKDPVVHVHRARACFRLEEHACVLDALNDAGNAGEAKPGMLLMRAEAAWRLGKRDAALTALTKGEKRFPQEAEFQRQQVFHLIDMGLYQEAALVSDRYLARAGMKAADYVAVGEALRVAKALRRAQVVMEGARLRFPEDENVAVQLAHCYLEEGKKFAAAMVFEDAARINPKFTLEAAELYKEAGALHRARWLNARVADQHAKSKQRLSLLLEGEEFDAVVAMQPKLSRLGLSNDDNVRYALAYSMYKTGRLLEAERELRLIKDPQLYESALQLQKAIAACREAGWECSP